MARKHLGWYTEALDGGPALRREANAAIIRREQLDAVERFFDRLATLGDRLEYRGNDRMAGQRVVASGVRAGKSQQTRSSANGAREALAA